MPAEQRTQRPPVMEDVAKLAGVSGQTVSRVLNAHPQVSDRTRERVEKAIETLGYRRNVAARSLVPRRSQIIGVLGSDLSQYGPANTLLGVERAAREEGYFVNVASLREVTTTRIAEAFEYFRSQSVDGIVVMVPHTALFETLKTMDVSAPFVAIGSGASERWNVTGVDQQIGARIAVQHLVELGHKSIAHISGPPEWIDSAARIYAWRETLTRAGLPESVLLQGNWSSESGYRAGLKLAANTDTTAVFVANDQMALGAMCAFAEAGLHVPKDISVIGYDDQPEAAYLTPPLTTVKQDFRGVGAHSVQRLLRAIVQDPVSAASCVSPRLVVRSSTAEPRG